MVSFNSSSVPFACGEGLDLLEGFSQCLCSILHFRLASVPVPQANSPQGWRAVASYSALASLGGGDGMSLLTWTLDLPQA